MFDTEAKRIGHALADNVIAIHHIGSTAIPDIYAKPIIDFLVEVRDIDHVDQQNEALETLGYQGRGEFGIPGRRYFRKDDPPGVRTHHVHIFEAGTANVERHLVFRDYLIAHPDAAKKYSILKRKLAKQYPDDIEGYMDGKDAFVKRMEERALQWHADQRGPLAGAVSFQSKITKVQEEVPKE